jgi:hypothetical protein
MRKYFCDKCGKELTAEELRFSLEMTGKELCSKDVPVGVRITKWSTEDWNRLFPDKKGVK